MTKKDLVQLTNQSFREAGGEKSFPNLKLGDILFVEELSEDHMGRNGALKNANNKMKQIAAKKGFSHVFNIEYDFEVNGDSGWGSFYCRAVGTGYASTE